MEQGIIAYMKKNYRTSLLKKRIEEGNDLKSFWKDYTIIDSIYDINIAWGLVKQTTLVKSWRKILPSVENTLIREEVEVSAFDLAIFSKSLTGRENVDEGNINEWINCNANDPGFERFSDEQIVSGALSTVLESEGEEEENDEKQCAVKQVSHEAPLKHIDGIIKISRRTRRYDSV